MYTEACGFIVEKFTFYSGFQAKYDELRKAERADKDKKDKLSSSAKVMFL